ncbi:MAG: hypothetical protein ACYCX4_00300 [Bacillota bacterium]
MSMIWRHGLGQPSGIAYEEIDEWLFKAEGAALEMGTVVRQLTRKRPEVATGFFHHNQFDITIARPALLSETSVMYDYVRPQDPVLELICFPTDGTLWVTYIQWPGDNAKLAIILEQVCEVLGLYQIYSSAIPLNNIFPKAKRVREKTLTENVTLTYKITPCTIEALYNNKIIARVIIMGMNPRIESTQVKENGVPPSQITNLSKYRLGKLIGVDPKLLGIHVLSSVDYVLTHELNNRIREESKAFLIKFLQEEKANQ